MDYQALAAEINSGPLAGTLAPLVAAGNDAAVAEALNAVSASHQVTRKLVESYEIVNATDPAEWASLTAQEKQRSQTLVGAGRVDLSNANVRSSFASMFAGAGGANTRAAIIALQTRDGSRAESVVGQNVSAADVARALRG